mgnify:CR=1 FL=1
MTVRNALLLVILTAIAVIAWYAGIDDTNDVADGDTPPPIQSGYYVLDAVIYGGRSDTRGVFEITAAQAQQSMRGEPILLTASDVVMTDANVEFLIGRSRLEALGMRATLSEDTINLRSNVRGQYTP